MHSALPPYECKNEAPTGEDVMHLLLSDMEIKADDAQPGKFSGYGAYFGNIDQGKDIVDAKAFDGACKAAGDGSFPHMFFNHNVNEPIGQWTSMAPDRRGLKMDGQLWLGKGIAKAEQAYMMLKSQGMAGLSIGFMCTKAEYDDKKGTRTILGADLKEVSVVSYPMNPKALVTSIKSILDSKDSLTIREAEEVLRDVANFSGMQAKVFLAKLTKGIHAQRDADALKASELQSLKESINKLNEALRGGGN